MQRTTDYSKSMSKCYKSKPVCYELLFYFIRNDRQFAQLTTIPNITIRLHNYLNITIRDFKDEDLQTMYHLIRMYILSQALHHSRNLFLGNLRLRSEQYLFLSYRNKFPSLRPLQRLHWLLTHHRATNPFRLTNFIIQH